MSKLERLKQKAKALEAKDPKGAIEAWLEAVKAQEAEAEPDTDPDLSIFNRIGDLYLKIKDAATAADYYAKDGTIPYQMYYPRTGGYWPPTRFTVR